jgi:hypothetical protein
MQYDSNPDWLITLSRRVECLMEVVNSASVACVHMSVESDLCLVKGIQI